MTIKAGLNKGAWTVGISAPTSRINLSKIDRCSKIIGVSLSQCNAKMVPYRYYLLIIILRIISQ
jgi:hypothetical protein